MSECLTLSLYLAAVAKRKSLDKWGVTNLAVLKVLENDDLPRLFEIIRVQDKAICDVISLIPDTENGWNDDIAKDMAEACSDAHIKVEALADKGDKSEWGGPQH